MSLEDRIAELNRQHSQAQERLQNLVTRRKTEKAKGKNWSSLRPNFRTVACHNRQFLIGRAAMRSSLEREV